MEPLTPKMVADRALAYLSDNIDVLNGIPRTSVFERYPDTRTKWQKLKSRAKYKVYSWRHSLACWITPYGFED